MDDDRPRGTTRESEHAVGTLILITGGVRSGKSRFAEQLAHAIGGDHVAYVATAEAGDAEMARKIARHRADRPGGWPTFEDPLDAARAIGSAAQFNPTPLVILVDCLTMLVSNLLLCGDEGSSADRVARQVAAIRESCRQTTATVLVVTNEVGWGVVPPSTLGRRYRDLLGHANQALAADAAHIYMMVAGLAVDWKTLALSPADCASALAMNPGENRP